MNPRKAVIALRYFFHVGIAVQEQVISRNYPRSYTNSLTQDWHLTVAANEVC